MAEVFMTKEIKETKKLANERWNWKLNANKVGMGDEYEFIYTYCSRLLHASPTSVTTDQKNLEDDEMLVFLRYILISMRTVLDLANTSLIPNGREH